MDDGAALLDTIAAHPADDLPRLVYADWLEDRGDTARAQFIRTHIRLARARPGSPTAVRLAAAAGELFRAHAAAWHADLAPAPVWRRLFTRAAWRDNIAAAYIDWPGGAYSFVSPTDRFGFEVRRGLVDEVSTRDRRVDLSAHPVAVLRVTLSGGPPGRALDQPALGRVRSLALTSHEPGVAGAAAELAASPHWRNLRALDVTGRDAGNVLAAVARSPLARRVRVLRAELLQAGCVEAVAGWPGDAGLEELGLGFNGYTHAMHRMRVSTAGVDAVAGSPLGRTLRRLSLLGAAPDARELRALAAGPAWPRLTALHLGEPFDPDREAVPAFGTFADAPAFPHVSDLRLPGAAFDDAAARAFAASAWPARLRRLDLSHTRVTIAGLAPLARALRDGPLERLDVRGCALAVDDVHRLCDLLGARVRFG